MRVSVISILIIFLVNTSLLSQDLITPGNGFKPFKYQGKKIKRVEIRDLIYSSGDDIAIRYINNYRGGQQLALPAMVLGMSAIYASVIIYDEESISGNQSSQKYFTVGYMLVGISTVASLASFKSLKNAVHRYNDVQQGTRISLGIQRHGLGINYTFR